MKRQAVSLLVMLFFSKGDFGAPLEMTGRRGVSGAVGAKGWRQGRVGIKAAEKPSNAPPSAVILSGSEGSL